MSAATSAKNSSPEICGRDGAGITLLRYSGQRGKETQQEVAGHIKSYKGEKCCERATILNTRQM